MRIVVKDNDKKKILLDIKVKRAWHCSTELSQDYGEDWIYVEGVKEEKT